MPINQSHIKLIGSRTMSDVPEGGGGPSGIALQSGLSNNIFLDVTEADRAGGDLSHRQLFLAVQSGDNEVAMGCNLIVQQPPTDPNVSIVLMETADDFATRADDIARLEAGYIKSGTYHGELFGNHIAGMSILVVQQRVEAPLPTIGQRLALVYREGQAGEETQYVSVQRITGNVVQTFTDDKGDFQRRILTLELGQTLTRAFPGYDAQRLSISASQLNNATRIRSCVWGNANKFYGVKPLTADAAQDDFTVQCSGIYERIVPSAEAETPLAALRINQQADAVVAAGSPISYTTSATFNTSTNLAIGGAVAAGTLSITRGGSTLTDDGGKLLLSGTQVGVFDYANGIATLVSSGFPTSGTMTVAYTPAVVAPSNVSSSGIKVTAENRRSNYVVTFPANCTPGSLQVHYRAAEQWYVLTEDGAGSVVGDNEALGGGTYSRSTRTLVVTLGALPDVGSMVILTFVPEDDPTSAGGAVPLRYDSRVVIPINSDGVISLDAGSKPFAPNSVSITWTDGASSRTVADNGAGALSGDGTGSVDYQSGRIVLIPANLPAWGTTITVQTDQHTLTDDPVSWSGSGASRTCTLAAAPKAGTVRFPLSLLVTYETESGSPYVGLGLDGIPLVGDVVDDGSGNLVFFGVTIGTVNYGTGVLSINLTGKSAALASGANASYVVGRTGIINVVA